MVGLGSGRAATAAIRRIGDRVHNEGLRITAVAASRPSHDLAGELGIPLLEPESLSRLDITIDGADEADPLLNVIKGGGGALVREKLLAEVSDRLVLQIEEPKQVAQLGHFHLPVAVIPFAWRSTASRLERHCKSAILRSEDGRPFVTDDGLFLLDLETGPITDVVDLERILRSEIGVVEVGLFVGLCNLLVIGHEDGTVTEKSRLYE